MSSDWAVMINIALIFVVTFVAKIYKGKTGNIQDHYRANSFTGWFYRPGYRPGSYRLDKI